MILRSLYELYGRLENDPSYQLAPPGYSLQKISFKVVLTTAGTLLDVQPLLDPDGRPTQIVVPGGAKPSGGVTPKSVHKKVQLLRNDVQFLLGVSVEESLVDGIKVRALVTDPDPFRFEAFRKYHLNAEGEIDDESFSVVCTFLKAWKPDADRCREAWADVASGQGVFQIQGHVEFVHDRLAIRDWWSAREATDGSREGQCLVTGEIRPIARLHAKLKGVRGAQPAGATIAGFNDSAYYSYGNEQSFNAPVSDAAAFRYVTALNALLDGPMRDKHRFLLGDMTVAFWTDKPSATEDIFARFLSDGSAALAGDDVQDEGVRQKIESFLEALRKGREAYGELADDPESTAFYLLGLSPNQARIAVRLFQRSSLGDLLRNLRRHYHDIATRPQSASGSRPADPEFPPAWLLLRQTARKAKDIPPVLAAPLLQAILTGSRYPDGLFFAVIRRIHADRFVNYARACVIKGYLSRNLDREASMSLDVQRMDTPYRLGRLFAALEKTQRDALGTSLNRTVKDTFYSSASATPRVVFPRLFRTYQHHIAKLDRGRVARERLVQEILEPLDEFPALLNLADQGVFALGYYHQTQNFYTKREPSEDKEPEEAQ